MPIEIGDIFVTRGGAHYIGIYEGSRNGNHLMRYFHISDFNHVHVTAFYDTVNDLLNTWEEYAIS
jgi:hypothetical protein